MIQIQIPLLEQKLLLPQLFPKPNTIFRPNLQVLRLRHDSIVAMQNKTAYVPRKDTIRRRYISMLKTVTQKDESDSSDVVLAVRLVAACGVDRARCCVGMQGCGALTNRMSPAARSGNRLRHTTQAPPRTPLRNRHLCIEKFYLCICANIQLPSSEKRSIAGMSTSNGRSDSSPSELCTMCRVVNEKREGVSERKYSSCIVLKHRSHTQISEIGIRWYARPARPPS